MIGYDEKDSQAINKTIGGKTTYENIHKLHI